MTQTSDETSGARENVSRHLMELYAIGAGLALAIGVERMVRVVGDTDAEIRWESGPVFLALLATLVPFYHGALRHLQYRWIDAPSGMTRMSMMVDFMMLFAGVSVMFAMAYLVTQPHAFAIALLVLLAVDCLWAVSFDLLTRLAKAPDLTPRRWLRSLLSDGMRYYRLKGREESFEELNWLWLNLASLAVGAALLAVVDVAGVSAGHWAFSVGVLGFAVARTLLDYRGSADFYFPGLPRWSEVRRQATTT